MQDTRIHETGRTRGHTKQAGHAITHKTGRTREHRDALTLCAEVPSSAMSKAASCLLEEATSATTS